VCCIANKLEIKEIFIEQDAEKDKALLGERRKLNNEKMNNFPPSPVLLESLAEGGWDVRNVYKVTRAR
jgi:hypothetical protein